MKISNSKIRFPLIGYIIILIGLVMVGVGAIGANAQTARIVRDISRTEPLRAELLGLIRPIAIRDVGAPVVFKVKQFRTNGQYAFFAGDAQRPNGVEIDREKTPLVRRNGPSDFWDCCHMEAVFIKQNGRWRVAEASLGSTDVWWETWCGRAPKGLIDECANINR